MRIAAALMIALTAAVANAQTAPREAFITVSGEGHVNVPPEFAEFFADVVTRAESLEAATRQHTERAAKAVAALRGMAKLGVSVERSSFRLDGRPATPRPAGQKQTPSEYRATTSFAVKVNKLDTLNDAVSSIAGANLFEVRNIRYGLKDEERAIDDARRAATR